MTDHPSNHLARQLAARPRVVPDPPLNDPPAAAKSKTKAGVISTTVRVDAKAWEDLRVVGLRGSAPAGDIVNALVRRFLDDEALQDSILDEAAKRRRR